MELQVREFWVHGQLYCNRVWGLGLRDILGYSIIGYILGLKQGIYTYIKVTILGL